MGHVGKARSRAGRGTSNKKREGTAEARRGSEQPKGAAEAVNGIGTQWGGKQENRD